MKNVGILTFHTAHNYGAVLQAFALQNFLKEHGVQNKIIDYQCLFNLKRFQKRKLSYFFNIKNIYHIFMHNSFEYNNAKEFDDFLTKYMDMSHPIFDKTNLAHLNNSFDAFICGSDQIWNLKCTEGDDSYFLPFVRLNNKKIAYAASFGVSDLPQEEKYRIKQLLKNFNSLSVREKEGCQIIHDLFGDKKRVFKVVDPTLLLRKQDWIQLADYSLCPKTDYLLMYLLCEDPEILKFSLEYAKKQNLKIAYISQRLFKRIDACYIRNATPNQWLGLFIRAKVVVTNSFHGTVFSINFNKDFFVKNIPNSKVNSRLMNLVDDYDLSSRLLSSCKVEQQYPEINYMLINEKLDRNRQYSIDYLNEELDLQF